MHFACRRVERHHGRRPPRSLLERVQAPPVQVVALRLPVDLAPLHDVFPQPGRLVRTDRGPSNTLGEQTGNRQRLIADHLRGQTNTCCTSQQAVFRIPLEQRRGDGGRLTIRGAGHDGALHLLHVPARVDEGGRQPVEQLRVAREIALRPEVVGGLDQAGPEVHLPETVDRDPGRERVRWIDEPAGERQAVLLLAFGKWRKHGRDVRSHELAGIVIRPADEPERIAPRLRLLHHHDRREALPQFLALLLELVDAPEGLQDVPGRVLVQEAEANLVGLRRGSLLRGELGDLTYRFCRRHHGRLFRRQNRAIDANVVDVALEVRLRRTAGTYA